MDFLENSINQNMNLNQKIPIYTIYYETKLKLNINIINLNRFDYKKLKLVLFGK